MEQADPAATITPERTRSPRRRLLAVLAAIVLFAGGIGAGRLLDGADDGDAEDRVVAKDAEADSGRASEDESAPGEAQAGTEVDGSTEGRGVDADGGGGSESSVGPALPSTPGPDGATAPAPPGTSSTTSPSPGASSGGTPGDADDPQGSSTEGTSPTFPPCDSIRLEGAFISARAAGGGTRQGRFELRNKGSAPCSLKGHPTLVFVKDGRLFPAPTEPLSTEEGRPVPMYGGSEPLSTKAVPGHAAFVAEWAVEPGGSPCERSLSPDKILIGMPDQRGAVEVSSQPLDGSGAFVICGGRVRVGPFTPS